MMPRTSKAPHCPRCGHPVVKSIARGNDETVYICPVNMPYQGCGWEGPLPMKGASHVSRHRPS